MNEHSSVQIERIVAFARYLSWADLLRTLFEAEIAKYGSRSGGNDERQHKWRWFGLMSYWYASLYVVIEAWDDLGFTDSIIDRLLADRNDFRQLLHRFRNGVFHYQSSLLDSRFLELLGRGAVLICWIEALHSELIRYMAEHFDGLMVTERQRDDFRGSIEAMVYWYPRREEPAIESLQNTLAYGREVLAKYPNDHSVQREAIERVLESAEETLKQGRQNWATIRARILREAGVELS